MYCIFHFQRIQITNINDAVVATALNNRLEYIEVAPCSTDLLARIIETVDHQNTVVVAQVDDDHALVGNMNQFYIYIYDMSKPPSEQLSILPENITFLGLRFDTAASLSPAWWNFLYQLSELEMLVMDCRPSMLGALLKRKNKVLTSLPNLTVIAITSNLERVTRPKLLQNALRETVTGLFNDVPIIENVIMQLVGYTAMDFGPMCQNMGVEHLNGKTQVTFNCFNENRRSIEEIDVMDIGRRDVRATANDDDGFDDDDEWQLSFKVENVEEHHHHDHLSDTVIEMAETTETTGKAEAIVKTEITKKTEAVEKTVEEEVSMKDAIAKIQIETYPDDDMSYSFIRDILGQIQKTAVDTCRKITKRWISSE